MKQIGEKQMPNVAEIERMVIGSCMADSECLEISMKHLNNKHFYLGEHVEIFKSIESLYNTNTLVDMVSVTQVLKKNNSLEYVGGGFSVAELTNKTFTVSNIEQNCLVIIEKYLLREIIGLSNKAVNLAYEANADCFAIMEKISNSINSLVSGAIQKEAKHVAEVGNAVIVEMEKILKGDVKKGVPISLAGINKVINGWKKSDFVILAARPAMGKTAVSLDFVLYPATQGVPTALFSLEMSKEQILKRLFSKLSWVNSEKINNGNFNQSELNAIKKENEELHKFPLFIDDTAGITIQQLRAKAMVLKRRMNIELIVIDYLQLIKGGKGTNREQEISQISMSLKQLAKELDIPIIALSQLSRAVELRANKRPVLSDLRDSGSLEQDADSVLTLFRPAYYGITELENGEPVSEQMLFIEILKNRHGKLDNILCKWIGENQNIFNWSNNDVEQTQESSPIIQNNNNFLNEEI